MEILIFSKREQPKAKVSGLRKQDIIYKVTVALIDEVRLRVLSAI